MERTEGGGGGTTPTPTLPFFFSIPATFAGVMDGEYVLVIHRWKGKANKYKTDPRGDGAGGRRMS